MFKEKKESSPGTRYFCLYTFHKSFLLAPQNTLMFRIRESVH